MKDIFGIDVQHGGSWILDGAVLSLANGDDLIVNSCTIGYNRPLNKILPLNNAKQYVIAGRGSGTISLGMIVGPSKGIKDFITNYADPCQITKNSMTIQATKGNACAGLEGESLQFVAHYCLLQGLNASVQSGDMAIVGAGMTLIIGALELK